MLTERKVERVISTVLRAGRLKILTGAALSIATIAIADWQVGNRASLGLLYIIPMMLAAAVLTPAGTILLAFLCALLRSVFDLPSPKLEVLLRFAFAVVATPAAG